MTSRQPLPHARLGLAVTQSIIARHQGQLQVGGHAGGPGARITFLLPVEEE